MRFWESPGFRQNLYAVVSPLVVVAVGYGWLTDHQGATVAGLATASIAVGFAGWNAYRQGVPIARQAVYAFVSAAGVAAAAFGWFTEDQVSLIVPAVLAVCGLFLAERHTDAETPSVASSGGLDGVPDDSPRRAM